MGRSDCAGLAFLGPCRVRAARVHIRPNFQKFSQTRYRGTGVAVIQTDEQMLLAQECVGNLRKILLEARKVHSQQDYSRMAAPILLEIQQREQEILEYLSDGLQGRVAS